MNTIAKGSNAMMSYWRNPNVILPADCKDLIITVSADGHIQTRIASDFLDEWGENNSEARNVRFWIWKP